MELRVESCGTMPAGAYVGVRVGETLKQGRYEAHRCYHFPALERRRNAKIDVFKHMGTCVVALDPENLSSIPDVKVSTTDPDLAELMLKVKAQATAPEALKQAAEKGKVDNTKAKDYLSKHRIQEKLGDAVKALLKYQPEDPVAFLCRHIGGSAVADPVSPAGTATAPVSPVRASKPAAAASASKPAAASAAAAVAEVLPFKPYYKANVIRDGGLKAIWAKFPARRAPAAASAVPAPKEGAPAAGAPSAVSVAPAEGKSGDSSFAKLASVGTWCGPRPQEQPPAAAAPRGGHFAPTSMLLGSGFHSFNLRPNFRIL